MLLHMLFLQMQKEQIISFWSYCKGFPLFMKNNIINCLQHLNWLYTTSTTALVYWKWFWMYYSKENSSCLKMKSVLSPSALTKSSQVMQVTDPLAICSQHGADSWQTGATFCWYGSVKPNPDPRRPFLPNLDFLGPDLSLASSSQTRG